MKHKHTHNDKSCEICRLRVPFVLPEHLCEEFAKANVVIFAGAGVSSESELVLKNTLYHHIAEELQEADTNLVFPDLMEKYVERPNGRLDLLKKIDDRLNRVRSFPELYGQATRFHRELATLFSVTTIVTTNWDNFFEVQCHAKPFVYPSDVAFWDAAPRRVLKIHGTENNYGSIIATRSDYEKCQSELSENLIGGKLKDILATKTVVYVGYSLNDDDFLQISAFVRDQMQGLERQAYVVTLDNSAKSLERFSDLRLIPIITDGTYFISKVKERLQSHPCYIDDDMYDWIDELLDQVNTAHDQLYEDLNMFDNPEIIYCGVYQDGLIHGLERILRRKGSGEYSHKHNVIEKLKAYEPIRKNYIRLRNYFDSSYVEGYQSALFSILNFSEGEDASPPLFYSVGSPRELWDWEEYAEALPEIPSWHKTSYAKAKKLASKYLPFREEGIVLHHRCEL